MPDTPAARQTLRREPGRDLRRDSRRAAGAALVALVLSAGLAGQAQAQAQPRDVQVPAGALDKALLALAAQTGHQLLYTPDLVAGRRTAGLSGRYAPEEAVARLIADKGLVVTRVGPNALTVKRQATSPEPAGARPPFGAEAAGAPPSAEAAPPPGVAAAEPARPPALLEEVRVTGSNIRGRAGPSPLIAISADDLARSGRATVAEALQTLPQNFAGDTTESVITTRSDRLGTNAGFGTGLNLRGLGSDATLVLVNGRRVAGSGVRGDFTDASAIPNAAVERVEVLLDGASAIYGSDAVGGVVNIILRRDFEGVELRLRGGAATRGEPREGQAGVVAGRTWAGGGGLLAYEAYRRTALDAADRRRTATADLRPFGGLDRRETLAFPGNILRTDPLTGASVPFYGVPAGQPGTALRPEDFQAGVVNRRNQNQGIDILPDQRRHSLYLAAHQELGPQVELSGDLRYSFRDTRARIGASTATLTVNRGNPFYVSPTGAASHRIQYSFGELLPNPLAHANAETLTGAFGARLRAPHDWSVDAYVGYGQEIDEARLTGVLQTLILNEALGVLPDDPATAFDARRDGYFNPFSGLANADPGVLAAIGSGFTHTRYRNQVEAASLQADGPLFAVGGGEVRVALGAQARRETYRTRGANYTFSAAPAAQQSLSADREVIAAFAEARVPLVSAENRRAGLERLELTGAVRAERYSDFGSTVNPKVGAIWSPLPGLSLRATYSESFRAPALPELYDPEIYTPIRFQLGAARLLTLALQGGNRELDPERATAWTAGFDVQPARLPGVRLSGTWFRIDFSDRIDRPVLANRAGVLSDPRLAPFVDRISPATSAADLARITALLADPRTTTALGVFAPAEYAAIVDIRNVNTSRLRVEGLDLTGAYAADALGGRLTVSGAASWMLSYHQRLTPADPGADLAGFVGNPAAFRARVGADWTRGRFGAGLALNHQSRLRDTAGQRLRAQDTVDLDLRLTGGAAGAFAGAALTLTVRNLFDQAPSFYDGPNAFGFDPGSGDIVGRFVALQLTRRW